ncbi:hypothetical protein Tco_0092460 [Tanacetum coccineum]
MKPGTIDPAPSLEDVGLPKIAGTSRLNSHDGSSRKENPSGDSVDLDRLTKSQTVVIPEVTITEPTRSDQRGATLVNLEMHLKPGGTQTPGLQPGGNPELTSCTSSASENLSDVLAQYLNFQVQPKTSVDDPIPSPPITTIITTKPTTSKGKKYVRQIVTNAKRFNPMVKQFKALQEKVKEQLRKMDEFIANKVPAAVQESVSAKVIEEVKNHAPTVVPDVVDDIVQPYTNLKKISHDDQDDLENREGEKRCQNRYFAGQSSSRNDQVMFEVGNHERQPSSTKKTRKQPDQLDRPPTKYTDYLWNRRSSAEERCLKVDKLNLRKLEEFRKYGYELVGNRFMSKAEYDYNLDQMTITMSDDMDWARDYGLGLNSKEPLPLVGPNLSRISPLEYFFNEDLEYLKNGNKHLKGIKYALSMTKRHFAEYKIGWIKEDICRLFRRTLVDYDVDVMLGIHHWEKMKRLIYRGKRSAITVETVYLDLKITFVDAVKVDVLFQYGFLESITVDSKNLLDRVSSCTSLFSLSERLKADNTIRVNQLVTILLIKSSVHLLDQNRYLVSTSLIHIEACKSPTIMLFDDDTRRISIRYCKTKEYHSECFSKISRIMRKTLVTTCELIGVQQV